MSHCQSIFEIFDRIFVVNLPERRDRRAETIQDLHKLSIAENDPRVIFFPAIKPESLNGFPSLGARGCFLSHLAIFKQIKALNLTSALIIEDDLAIHPQLINHLDHLKQQVNRYDWGFIYLGHVESVASNGELHLHPYTKPIMTTHCYAIHQSILDSLINFLELILTRPPGHPDGGPMHVDGAFSTFRQQNPNILTLLTIPNMGWQRSSRSDVAESLFLEKLPIIPFLLNVFRKSKNYYRNWRLK
jgi:hypothetical protein